MVMSKLRVNCFGVSVDGFGAGAESRESARGWRDGAAWVGVSHARVPADARWRRRDAGTDSAECGFAGVGA